MLNSATAWLDNHFYRNEDGTWPLRALASRVRKHAVVGQVLLDLGAGSGNGAQLDFRDLGTVYGIDPEPSVLSNPFLHHKYVGAGEELPFSDSFFDSVVSCYVLEHLSDPTRVFSEVHRVLKPGGSFHFLTPNRGHYVALLSSLTPTSFHKWYNNLRGRHEEDTFPTVYRANTTSAVRRVAKEVGFEGVDIETIEGRPEYLRIFALAYVAGIAYERVVNSVSIFSPMRVNILGSLRKG